MKKQLTEKQWEKVMKVIKSRIVCKDENKLREMLVELKGKGGYKYDYDIEVIENILGDRNDPDYGLHREYGISYPIVATLHNYFDQCFKWSEELNEFIDTYYDEVIDREFVDNLTLYYILTFGFKTFTEDKDPYSFTPTKFYEAVEGICGEAFDLSEGWFRGNGWLEYCNCAMNNGAEKHPIRLEVLKALFEHSKLINEAIMNIVNENK